MPESLAELGAGFDMSARQAQLAVLFLLASALRDHGEALYDLASDLPGTWIRYPADLAEAFVDAFPEVTEPTHALLIWKSFTARQQAKRAPSAILALLEEIRNSIGESLQRGFDPRRHLARANESARMAIEGLVSEIGLTARIPINLAQISISWEVADSFQWPSTAFKERRIQWIFQCHPWALWEAMIAQPILQHEYLSHLLPESDSLSARAREGWLMEVLADRVRNAGFFEHRVLVYVRHQTEALGRSEADGLPEAVLAMQITRPELYSSFTKDILTLPSGSENADCLDEVLVALRKPSLLKALLADPAVTGLASLHSAVKRMLGCDVDSMG